MSALQQLDSLIAELELQTSAGTAVEKKADKKDKKKESAAPAAEAAPTEDILGNTHILDPHTSKTFSVITITTEHSARQPTSNSHSLIFQLTNQYTNSLRTPIDITTLSTTTYLS